MRSKQAIKEEASYKETTIPSMPLKVQPRDLSPKGLLLSDEVINKITRAAASGELIIPDGKATRITKKELKILGIDSDYNVVVEAQKEGGFKIFAIHKGVKQGAELGRGTFGNVKIIQDQTTGQYFAFKTQASTTDGQKNRIDYEKHLLNKVGQLETSVNYQPHSKEGKERYGNEVEGYIMKLAPGSTLSDLIHKDDFSTAQRFTMIIDIIDALAELHQKRIIHADLKFDNIIYEPVSRKVTIIDYTASLQMEPNGEEIAFVRGSPTYMSPEQRKKYVEYNQDRAAGNLKAKDAYQLTYSNKTDYYNVGLLVANILNLSYTNDKDVPHYEIKKDAKNNPFFKDEATAQKILNELKQITHPSPEQRADLAVLRQHFVDLQVNLRNEADHKFKVAILNLKDYEQANDQSKKELLASLSAFDHIQLVYSDEKINFTQAQLIKRELEGEGFAVKETIIHDKKTPEKLIQFLQLKSASLPFVMDYKFVKPSEVKKSQELKIQEIDIPYLPSKVAIADLSPSNKLLTQKTLHHIKSKLANGNLKLNANGEGRFTKAELEAVGIKSKSNIFVRKKAEGYEIFAIYKGQKKGKSLGSGTYGSVKLIQNQDSGEFFALKTQRIFNKREEEGLKQAGHFIDSFSYEPKSQLGKKKYQPEKYSQTTLAHATISKLAPSESLTHYKPDATKPLKTIHMLLDVARTLHDIHQKNILHFDVKPDNIHYDSANRKATVVDFGQSVILTNDPNQKALAQGTRWFAPPETREQLTAETEGKTAKFTPVVANKSIDVYSLGISLALSLDLTKKIYSETDITRAKLENKKLAEFEPHHYEIAKDSDPEFKHNYKISDPALRKELLNLLSNMTSKNPKERPPLSQIVSALENIEKKITQSSQLVIIDLKEYEKLANDERLKLAEKLVLFDQIQLINSNQDINLGKTQLLIKEIADLGLPIKRSVTHGDKHVNHLVASIAEKNPNANLTFLTNEKLTPPQLNAFANDKINIFSFNAPAPARSRPRAGAQFDLNLPPAPRIPVRPKRFAGIFEPVVKSSGWRDAEFPVKRENKEVTATLAENRKAANSDIKIMQKLEKTEPKQDGIKQSDKPQAEETPTKPILESPKATETSAKPILRSPTLPNSRVQASKDLNPANPRRQITNDPSSKSQEKSTLPASGKRTVKELREQWEKIQSEESSTPRLK